MQRQRDDRGQSVTVFVAVVVMALLLVTGLVVDGGRQAAATRTAHGVAAAAARAAADAAAADVISGGDGRAAAVAAGQRMLAGAGMTGTVTVVPGGARVETSTTVPTIFLSVIGITALPVRGSATSQQAVVR